jgi:hypothetical protein
LEFRYGSLCREEISPVTLFFNNGLGATGARPTRAGEE